MFSNRMPHLFSRFLKNSMSYCFDKPGISSTILDKQIYLIKKEQKAGMLVRIPIYLPLWTGSGEVTGLVYYTFTLIIDSTTLPKCNHHLGTHNL